MLRSAVATVLAALLLFSFAQGCTSNAATCDSSKCAAGNTCIDDGTTGSKCRLLCQEHTDCPWGYHCSFTPDGSKSFCAQDATQYVKKESGQWGASCNPTGGLDSNPSCDADQNFWCYGTSPTDGAAYCTQYQCNKDDDCAGGFWCARINIAPDVRTDKRTYGVDQTTTVCLKRDYCSTCRADMDCPQTIDGQVSHCVAGKDGVKFCSQECTRDSNCRLDATCTSDNDVGAKLCMPRAGTCKGDGTLCSPCRSDADCGDGFCVEESYSHERYCTQKSKTPCEVAGGKLQADCPKVMRGKQDGVSCATGGKGESIPKDQCYGLVQFGSDNSGNPTYADGCWTIDRL